MCMPGLGGRRPWLPLCLLVGKSDALLEPALGVVRSCPHGLGPPPKELQYWGPGRAPGSLMLLVAENMLAIVPPLDIYLKREGPGTMLSQER